MISMPPPTGELLAWDPVAQKAVWRAKYPVLDGGGVLATGGNLVFQGRADGIFAAFRATDGEQVWRFDAATGIMAPPVTYTVDGVQYVTVMAGWGGSAGLMNIPAVGAAKPGWGRILTFALDAKAALKAPPFGHTGPPLPAITAKQDPQTVHTGALLFNSHCFICHGLNAVAGPLPDLRYSTKETLDSFAGDRPRWCASFRMGCLRLGRSFPQRMWQRSAHISSREHRKRQSRRMRHSHSRNVASGLIGGFVHLATHSTQT